MIEHPSAPRPLARSFAAWSWVAALATAGALSAQTPPRPDRSDEVLYPATDDTVQDVGVDQIGSRGEDTKIDAPAQVATDRDDNRPVAQVGGRDGATPLPQLSTGGRSAQASTPLSTTGQSTPQAVARLGNDDRCDGDARGDRATPDICATPIETRSAEFQRPNPLKLSPEQRLLVDQRLRAGIDDNASAARRIARNDIDENSFESQSIAAMALPRPGAPDETGDPAGDPLQGFDQPTLDILQVIVEGLGGQTPPPQQ